MAAVLAGCGTTPGTASRPEGAPAERAAPSPTPAPAAAPVRVSVAAVGDLMLGTDFPEDRLPPDDGVGLLAPAAELLRGADIAFGNLEGVLLDGGEPAKTCRNPAHCYLFRTPARYAYHLWAAGFDVLSLANNHARDFGEEGRSATMANLDAVGIRHSGRVGDVASWIVKGVPVALIAFAPFGGSFDLLNLDEARDRVREAAAGHELVIVSIHAGAEGEAATSLPFGPETYHGEARGDVVAFARAVVEAGADLVLGHGPHVPRALELYRGRLIAYSLGNFCTYWGIRVDGLNGLAPLLLAELDGQGRFLGGRIVSYRQQRPWGPVPDPSHAAARLIARLTGEDFPAGTLEIDPQGRISTVSAPAPAAAPPPAGKALRVPLE